MEQRDCVVLFKKEKDSDPYRLALEDDGFDVIFAPLLEFRFVNSDQTKDIIQNKADCYGGIVFTSQRAVEAIENFSIPNQWKDKKIFSFGEECTSSVAKLFDIEKKSILGYKEECSSAEDLAKIISSHFQSDIGLPLLFLCGNKRRDELPNSLKLHNIPFEEFIVYETQYLSDEITESLIKSLFSLNVESNTAWTSRVKWIVFFSPSGIEYITELIKDINPLSLQKDIRVACIGSTTRQAFENILSPKIQEVKCFVPQKPSAKELVCTICTNSGIKK